MIELIKVWIKNLFNSLFNLIFKTLITSLISKGIVLLNGLFVSQMKFDSQFRKRWIFLLICYVQELVWSYVALWWENEIPYVSYLDMLPPFSFRSTSFDFDFKTGGAFLGTIGACVSFISMSPFLCLLESN